MGGVEFKSILEREIPHLRPTQRVAINDYIDFEVAKTDTKDFKEVEFCSNCLGYENDCCPYMNF